MPDMCLGHVQACRLRMSRLEPNGVPQPGAENIIVSDALSVLTITPVYSDGDEIEEKNACGDVAVNFKGNDSFKRADVALTILTQDPYISEFLAGGALLEDGDAVGYGFPEIGPVTGNGVSLELWAKRANDGELDVDYPYAWWALPKVTNLRQGERQFQNGNTALPFQGQAYENTNWFDGPENDWPVASSRVAQWIPTTTIPDASCGYQTLAAS